VALYFFSYNKGAVEPIQLAREGPKFLHTPFTDDIILFVEATCEQAKEGSFKC